MSELVKDALGLYTVEYSLKDRNFHLDTLAGAIRTNRGSIAGGNQPGYIVIGIFQTSEEADNYVNKLRASSPDVFKEALDEDFIGR